MVKMKLLFELLRLIYMHLVIFFTCTNIISFGVVRVLVTQISSNLKRSKLKIKNTDVQSQDVCICFVELSSFLKKH